MELLSLFGSPDKAPGARWPAPDHVHWPLSGTAMWAGLILPSYLFGIRDSSQLGAYTSDATLDGGLLPEPSLLLPPMLPTFSLDPSPPLAVPAWEMVNGKW